MMQVLLLIHVVAAVLLIALVLLQQGRGADMGASFGAGASQTLFGSRGSASFLSKLTGYTVAVFFVTSLGLTTLSSRAYNQTSITTVLQEKTTPSAPTMPDIPS